MENNIEEKKRIIIKWLNEFGRLPTSRFVGLTGWSYDFIKKLLDEMESDNILVKEEETKSIYWRINNGKEI